MRKENSLELTLKDQLELIKPIWRILLLSGLFQILGALIYVIIGVKSMVFFNIWYGGAYFTPLGFILGLLWHIYAVKNGFSDNKWVILSLAIFAFYLPISAYLIDFESRFLSN